MQCLASCPSIVKSNNELGLQMDSKLNEITSLVISKLGYCDQQDVHECFMKLIEVFNLSHLFGVKSTSCIVCNKCEEILKSSIKETNSFLTVNLATINALKCFSEVTLIEGGQRKSMPVFNRYLISSIERHPYPKHDKQDCKDSLHAICKCTPTSPILVIYISPLYIYNSDYGSGITYQDIPNKLYFPNNATYHIVATVDYNTSNNGKSGHYQANVLRKDGMANINDMSIDKNIKSMITKNTYLVFYHK